MVSTESLLHDLNEARARTLALLANLTDAQLMVLSSRMEGGANVISEACVARLPVIASRIPGSVGLLGDDYPGYYPVADTAALTELLLRAERDRRFYAALKKHCAARAPLFTPARERAGLKRLLAELA